MTRRGGFWARVGGGITAGLVGVDMLVNVLTGGIWHQTISLRAALARPNPIAEVVCAVASLVVFERDHCDRTLARHRP